jgi:hypothetical protein
MSAHTVITVLLVSALTPESIEPDSGIATIRIVSLASPLFRSLRSSSRRLLCLGRLWWTHEDLEVFVLLEVFQSEFGSREVLNEVLVDLVRVRTLPRDHLREVLLSGVESERHGSFDLSVSLIDLDL